MAKKYITDFIEVDKLIVDGVHVDPRKITIAHNWGDHGAMGYATTGTNTQLTDAQIAAMGYIKTYTDTNTQLTTAQIGAMGYATTGYVTTAISNLVDSSPATLNTLNELAAALGDDPNFATTVTNSIATKLPLSGGVLTGALDISNGQVFRLYRGNGNAHQRVDARLDGTDQARLHWYGKNDGQSTTNFKHAWYDGSNYINVTAASGTATFGGVLAATGGNSSQWNTAYTHSQAAHAPSNANYITNNNQLTNGAGYTTNTGTLTSSIGGTKLTFVSGSGGTTFGANHYSMGIDIANGSWNSPNYSDLIIGYHTGIRFGASYNGMRFYANSPTTDTNNTGHGNGGEALILTVGGTAGTNDTKVEGIGYAGESFRSPIFYDSNNTDYYLNPAGESLVSKIRINNGGAAGIGWATGLVMGDASNYWNLIQDAGTARQRNYGTGGYDWYNNTASTQLMILSNTGVLSASSDMRAPIFYDSNNTGYYGDFASTGTSVKGQGVSDMKGGFKSTANPWNTSDSAFFPNGITTAGGTNWIYGNTYVGNAPSNGAGTNFGSNGTELHISSQAATSHGASGKWENTASSGGNFTPYSFETTHGNHSWGMVARFRINTTVGDRPSIQFSHGTNDTRWNIGYCAADDNFRVNQNMGYRNDNSTSDGWGTERLKIDTSGNLSSNGIYQSNASLRAPIFYDSNNTGYYLDPASTSNVNAHKAYSYQGNGNVGGTGLASWHPSGMYSGSTQWLYGTMHRNGASTQGGGSAQYSIVYDTNDTNYYTNPGATDYSGVFRQHVTIGDSALYKPNSGNWGARLNVVDNVHSKITVGQDANSMLSVWYTHTGQSGAKFGMESNHSLELVTNNSTRLTIDTTGDINSTAGWFKGNNGDDPAFICGANSSYGAGTELYLGGWTTSTNVSRIRNSNGNLHIDSKSGNEMYLNHYPAGNVFVGNGGGFLQAYQSVRSPIFYDSNNTGFYTNPASTSHLNTITCADGLTFTNNYGSGITGLYSSTRLQTIFNMGAAYKINNAGTAVQSAYGLYWSHQNAGALGGASNLASHGMIILEGGTYKGSWGGGRIVTTESVRAPIFYDSNNTGYYTDPGSTSNLWALTVNGGNLNMYENGTYSSELTFQNNTHKFGIDYQNNETIRFITRSGTTTVPITFQMRAGTITASNFILSSDERKKTKIKDLSCDNIDTNWKSFEMKNNEGEYRVGVIAQELEIKHPEFVNTDNEGFKSVKYIDLLIAKIAELEARLEKAGI